MVHYPTSRLTATGYDIVCDEVGTPNARFWEGPVADLGSDYESVLSHARQKTIRVFERRGILEIHGRDRVGTIRLPSGRRVLLRTKISGIVVLEWLVFLREFPDLQLWSSGGNIQESDSWQKVIASLFLRELEVLTRIHLRKGFVEYQRESSQVQGRILSHRLAQRPWRLPSIPQIIRGRSINTPANQMLAAALDELTLFMPELDLAEVNIFQRLRNQWADISRQEIDRQSLISASQAAPPDGYRTAMQLARLILRGAAIDPRSGSGGHAFTLSLARIWEHAITQICRELRPHTDWRVAPRSQSSRAWDDAIDTDERHRSLIADTLLARGAERWVLDAKYKRSFGDEDRNDRFQMCAYAVAFQAQRATLVYPTINSQNRNHRILLNTTHGNQQLTIDSIACEMAAGPSACKRRFRAVLTAENDYPA